MDNVPSGDADNPAIQLITTSLRETWPAGGRVLLAGQWCLDYNERHRDAPYEFTMTPYHWDDRAQLRADYEFLHDLSSELLEEVRTTLNRIHGEERSLKFWRIVLGWWVESFVQVYFDRWKVIEAAASIGQPLRLSRLPPADPCPALADVTAFMRGVLTATWNERLFADIAELNPHFDVQLVPVTHTPRGALPDGSTEVAPSSVRRLSIKATEVLDRLSPRHVWLHQTNLRPLQRRLLEFSIPQLPRHGGTPTLEGSTPQTAMRQWAIAEGHDDPFVRNLGAAIAQHLPTVYLEDWQASLSRVRNAFPGPPPRILFTAVAPTADDAWAIRAATCQEQGSELVIAQNGGHYGTGAWCTIQDHEVAIADRFLSWGWTNPDAPNIRPAPATRLMGQRAHTGAPEGLCLQVTAALPQQSFWLYSIPVAGQVLSYIDDQIAFSQALSSGVRTHHRVRLHRHDYGWRFKERWRDIDPQTSFADLSVPMSELIAQTRLYIATYNATTYLESLSMGVPTMIFWNPDLWELSADAAPYFGALRSAGILYDDPVTCAQAVDEVWPNVEDWWKSSEVSYTTREFVNHFARVGPTPLRQLRRAILGHPES